jgi:hypothetical protein
MIAHELTAWMRRKTAVDMVDVLSQRGLLRAHSMSPARLPNIFFLLYQKDRRWGLAVR